MRVGFLAACETGRVAFARANGFGSVELLVQPESPCFPGQPDWASKAREIAAAWREAGMRMSCIGGFYVNHLDPQRGAAFAERVRGTIRLAREMGVNCVAGFAGRIVGEPLETSLPAFTKVWSEHARLAADHGVRIAIEHCPMGCFHMPEGGINCMCTPLMWEKCFDAVPHEALGLEWDPSHLICLGIDPVETLARFGGRVFHVHGKDARVNRRVTMLYGRHHPDAAEHVFPGYGEADWRGIVRELLRQGYAGDLNIEGWHDAVFRDDAERGFMREDAGLIAARRYLAECVPVSA